MVMLVYRSVDILVLRDIKLYHIHIPMAQLHWCMLLKLIDVDGVLKVHILYMEPTWRIIPVSK